MSELNIIKDKIKENTDALNKLVKNIELLFSSKRYLKKSAAAKYVGVSPQYLDKYKNEIGYSQRDKDIIFDIRDIDKWLYLNKIKGIV
jgi:hypothetical protein